MWIKRASCTARDDSALPSTTNVGSVACRVTFTGHGLGGQPSGRKTHHGDAGAWICRSGTRLAFGPPMLSMLRGESTPVIDRRPQSRGGQIGFTDGTRILATVEPSSVRREGRRTEDRATTTPLLSTVFRPLSSVPLLIAR